MRRAVVTGADGFLGRHLVPFLEQNGVEVTALTRRPLPGKSHIAMGDAPWHPARLAEVIAAVVPDVIFHLAGGAGGSGADLERSNLGTAMSVMQAIREVQDRPLLVCCGSAAEYGAAIVDGIPITETTVCDPVSAYGTSKLAQTKATLDFSLATGTPVLIARIFNPIGPGMAPYLALGDFASQIAASRAQGVLQTGNIHVYRDFIDVIYVTKALYKLASNPAARGIVNVCSGEATQLSRLVDLLIGLSGKNIAIKPVAERIRLAEPSVVIGSTALLDRFGAAMPPTNYQDVMAQIWDDALTRQAAVQ